MYYLLPTYYFAMVCVNVLYCVCYYAVTPGASVTSCLSAFRVHCSRLSHKVSWESTPPT